MTMTADERQEYVDMGLTESEIAGMEDLAGDDNDFGEAGEEWTPEKTEAAQREAGPTNDADPVEKVIADDDKSGDEKSSQDAAEVADDGEPKGEDDGINAEASSESDKSEVRAETRPLITVELPEDYEDQVAAIGTDRDALTEKFEDGDLTTKEYNDELKSINDREFDLKTLKNNADLSQNIEENRARADWIDTTNQFLADNPDFQKTADGDALFNALNNEVMRIAGLEDSANLTGVQILTKARDSINRQLGRTAVDSKKEDGEPVAPKAVKKEVLPINIGKLPASAATDADDGNPYKQLDSMSAVEREDALSRMTDDQREQYYAS